MKMNELIEKADVLLEALPYIQEFHDAQILVKFGGSAMEDPAVTASVRSDSGLAMLTGGSPGRPSVILAWNWRQSLASSEATRRWSPWELRTVMTSLEREELIRGGKTVEGGDGRQRQMFCLM